MWVEIEENVLGYFNPCFSTLKILYKHENGYKHFSKAKWKDSVHLHIMGNWAKSLKIKVTVISIPGLLNSHTVTLKHFLCATSRVETYLSKRRKVLPTITKHFQSFKWQHSFSDKPTWFCSTQLPYYTINSCPLTVQSASALLVF